MKNYLPMVLVSMTFGRFSEVYSAKERGILLMLLTFFPSKSLRTIEKLKEKL